MKWFFNPLEFIKYCTFYIGGDDEPAYVPIRPSNVSTGFGTGRADPERGQYSYTLDPRLAQMRDIFYNATNQFMPTAEEQQFARGVSNTGMSTFGRGNEFLNQALGLDTAQIGQDYYNQVQNLMAMDRAQEEARLADTLFKTGRTGAAIGVQGGYLNPEQFALLKAREQANQQLAINANQLGRAQREGDVGFASKLMGSGLNTYEAGKNTALTPYQNMASLFGLGTNLEGLGLNANLGTAISTLPYQQAVQQNQQAYENAKAASGGKGGLGGLLQTGMDIFSAAGGFGGLGDSISSIFGGSSPSSGIGSLFGSNGFGNANAVTPFGTWSPIDTNIGMGGYSAPANYGGGFGYPRY